MNTKTAIELVRVRVIQGFVRLLSQAVFLSLFVSSFCTAAQPPGAQRVLVLYSDERLLPANVIFDHSFRTNLQAGASRRIEFHSEFLDVARFSGEAQQERQRNFLREKYRDYPPDLIIAVSGSAVAFLMQYRASLFTEAPIVYLTWQGEVPPRDLDPKAAGISTPGSGDATIRLALDLQQDTRYIAVVTGSSQRDKALAEEARKGSSAFKNRVAFTWLTGLSLPELREELARLPDHSVVLYLTMFQDAVGNRFTPREALDQFAPASRVPIYGYYDTYLGHGIVGGSMVTFEEIGRKTAQAGLRILAGESPQDVARSEIQGIPMFDWRELWRWNFGGKQLPPGSVVLFKKATYWEKHHWLILGVVTASLVEGLLIAVLFAQLRRRRQAEAFLRESEERLNLATTSAGAGLWAIDQTTRQIWLTDRARELFSLSAGKAPDWESLLNAIHPDDREQMQNSVEEALHTGKEFIADFRVVCTDGSARWISSRGRTQFGSQAKLQRLMGACVDITERRKAEAEARQHLEELAHLSRVAIMGEMAGSLAHELNQPLTGIVNNASAGRRFIAKGRADLAKLDCLFEAVAGDGRRAGEIIRGIRSMVRKGEEVRGLVNLNEVIASVLRFVGSDALERHCALVTELDVKLPFVEANQVQLQQVLLNLVVNAFDVIREMPAEERRVIIRSECESDRRVRVSVRDFGTGLPAEEPERIFQKFFSTKREGMGMGLAIARSIITSHGGELAATNA
ncbi:MAG: PAS domain-containing protein, partial [Verrucomicrobia bacterium]|nr:PAS domain-containing protein [Verrucomicrobiota bacterium]